MTSVTGIVTVGGIAYPVSAPITLPAPTGAQCQFGLYTPSNTIDWSGMQTFGNVPVKVDPYYSGFGEGFQVNVANVALSHGAVVFAEIEPWNSGIAGFTPGLAGMQAIANGTYDSYLISYANSIKAWGHPVMLTFAHEMNGTWYPWGSQAVTPAQWVTTWQHVVTTMNAIAGSQITWVWAPNIQSGATAVTPYWPGQQYVGLAAFDGYLFGANDTYASAIAPTVAAIRKLTSGPIWNAETGITTVDSNRATRYTKFIADMKAGGLSGFLHFNQSNYALTATESAAVVSAVNLWNAS